MLLYLSPDDKKRFFLDVSESINKLLLFIIDNNITLDVEQQLHMYVKLKLFICTLVYF